jgi:hypothetical protein
MVVAMVSPKKAPGVLTMNLQAAVKQALLPEQPQYIREQGKDAISRQQGCSVEHADKYTQRCQVV